MKLLIVDDEIRAVQALVKRVNWQEYDFEPPLAAYSMAQAQGVFQQQEIYLMLCDIEMPQGSGLELFEWVKTYYPLTECIFVTCHDEYSYLRSAMQLGSCDYLLKPINYTLLQEALKNVVERIQRRKDKPAGSAEQPKDSLLPANTLNVSNPYIRQLLHVLSERLTENLPIRSTSCACSKKKWAVLFCSTSHPEGLHLRCSIWKIRTCRLPRWRFFAGLIIIPTSHECLSGLQGSRLPHSASAVCRRTK